MKVYLESLGCRLNESERETMARQFAAAGHQLVADSAEADLTVLNTCAVTADAVRSSRQRIRQLNRSQPNAAIVVTGCDAHLAPDKIAALPGVSRVINNLDKDRLVSIVLDQPIASEPADPADLEPIARDDKYYRPDSLGHTRAFVKVQDGCDNRCTFCITRVARGAGRSRSIGEVVAEIQAMHAAGYQEAILTGVQLGSFGERSGGLHDLVAAVLADTDMPRIRLSSLEPWDLNEAFFVLWANPRLLPHLHLPLQSGCDSTLRRMLRRTSQTEYRALIDMARSLIPTVAISTDVIVGFPGETEAEYAISREFIAEMNFMKLHVFPYSPRPGTAAARLPNPIDPLISKTRVADLRSVSAQGERRYHESWLGKQDAVLWENVIGATPDGWRNTGLTRHYVRAFWTGNQVLTNRITAVQIDGIDGEGVRCVLA